MMKKKYLANKPEFNKLLNCRSLKWQQLTAEISRVGGLREELKEKSGRLKDLCLPISPLYFVFIFFYMGPQKQLCVAFAFIPHNI